MSLDLKLIEKKHPSKDAEAAFERLVGIEAHKESLLDFLELTLRPEKFNSWIKKNHSDGLPFAQELDFSSPLIILSGEVGCGKTALAGSVATPLGKRLDSRVLVLETPTNLRGSGLVGEISKRITDAFSQARTSLTANNIQHGILILDEADDLATSRSQMQAHHEDRAGLNALIKQLDKLKEDKVKLAVVLITNRLSVLDPAVRRRASLELVFERPGKEQLELVFQRILSGTSSSKKDIKLLVDLASSKPVPFSYSDLTQKVAKAALLRSFRQGQKFSPEVVADILKDTEPSPMLEDSDG